MIMKKIRMYTAVFLSLASLLLLTAGGKIKYSDAAYIKWVECNVSSEIMKKAAELDVRYHKQGKAFGFIDAIACLAVQNGNHFSYKKDAENLNKLVKRVESGETLSELYSDNKYVKYYKEAYGAALGGLVGSYTENGSEETRYGVRGFFPLAKGFWYNDYDDFGSDRNFGFKRKHLGHDLMGSVGTPIIAVEGGVVTECGWNRYGGWRVGIRSYDGKRYYYYAHMKKDKPYATGIEKDAEVQAGQVIGYLGNTGYSDKENQNLQSGNPHLHFGMQLIFDESQKDGNNEIWIDVYQICKFLSAYRAKVQKIENTREYQSLSTHSAV